MDKLVGPPDAVARLRVVIESLTGRITVDEACKRLGIGDSRFYTMRDQALRGALDALIRKPPGPKRAEPDPQSRIDALTKQVAELQHQRVVADLQHQLQVAQLQARLAPHTPPRDGEPPPDTTRDDHADASDAGTPAKKGATGRPRRRRPKRH